MMTTSIFRGLKVFKQLADKQFHGQVCSIPLLFPYEADKKTGFRISNWHFGSFLTGAINMKCIGI